MHAYSQEPACCDSMSALGVPLIPVPELEKQAVRLQKQQVRKGLVSLRRKLAARRQTHVGKGEGLYGWRVRHGGSKWQHKSHPDHEQRRHKRHVVNWSVQEVWGLTSSKTLSSSLHWAKSDREAPETAGKVDIPEQRCRQAPIHFFVRCSLAGQSAYLFIKQRPFAQPPHGMQSALGIASKTAANQPRNSLRPCIDDIVIAQRAYSYVRLPADPGWPAGHP